MNLHIANATIHLHHSATGALQDFATLLEQLEGITALLRASHSHHDRARVAQVLRRRGHAVEGDLSKIYRSNA